MEARGGGGLAADLARVEAGAGARRLADAPAQTLTWNLDASSFEGAIIEQLRTADDIPLRLLLERFPAEAGTLARGEGGGTRGGGGGRAPPPPTPFSPPWHAWGG